VFRLALFLTRRRLRILCYHGFSVGAEHLFSPFMFMRPERFESRLKLLASRGIPVIGLADAIERHAAGRISKAETVITLDDGWKTNITLGLPLLKRFSFPACVYVTTEHLADNLPVFNVALWYMLWKAGTVPVLRLHDAHPAIDGDYALGEATPTSGRRLMDLANSLLDLPQKQALLGKIAQALGLRIEDVLREERFNLVTAEEMRLLMREGIDVQLHTHSHQLPATSFDAMAQEVVRNRDEVEGIIGSPRQHFCYPSGRYDANHPQWLAKLGLRSATTCDSGFNLRRTDPLLLRRYLDRDDSSDLMFDAEICGVMEIARGVRAVLGNGKNRPVPQAAESTR
jgi:peptidoglycan/xylan/chitin deacetylase (PgdA/CDA1 family)